LLGFRARLCAALCWLLVLSLQKRNGLVLHSGDHILVLLLLWCTLLPIGARWSVDARRGRGDDAPVSFAGPAALGVQLQLALVYIDTGLRKLADRDWLNGLGVVNALEIDHMIAPLGVWLKPHHPMLVLLGYGTLALELIAVLLLLAPDVRGRLRTSLALTFISFHLALGASLQLGTFSFICISGWLAILPTPFWEGLRRRRVAERTAARVASPRSRLRTSPINDMVSLLLCCYLMLVTGILALDSRPGLGALLFPGRILAFHYRWTMFVTTGTHAGTVVTIGVLPGGDRHPLLVAGSPRTEAEPRFAGAQIADARWRKYLETFFFRGETKYLADYLRFFCKDVSRPRATGRQFAAVELVYESHPIRGNHARAQRQNVVLGQLTCEPQRRPRLAPG
jgi:hypothetical protein